MKILSGLITIIVLVLAITFAVANGQGATVNLWPFGIELEAPLYLLTLGTLILGLLLGTIVTWLSLLPCRFAVRRLRKETTTLREKLNALQESVRMASKKPESFLSAPKKHFWEKFVR